MRWTMLGWTGFLLAGVIASFCALLQGRVARAVYAGIVERLVR